MPSGEIKIKLKFESIREIAIALSRISKMIRGIGDPLVATYARCYLIRIGFATCENQEYMKECFRDFFNVYHTVVFKFF